MEGEVQVDGNQQPNNALNSDSVASLNNIAIKQQLLDDCARDSNSEEDWFDQPVTVPCDHKMIDEPVLTDSTEDVLAQLIVESDNIVEPMEMDIMDPSLEASPASPVHFEPIQQREPSPMEIEHEESKCQPRIPPPEAGPVLELESTEIVWNNWS